MSDAPTISQTGRLLSLTSPLGADVLIPVAVEGEEGLSRLFRYTITMISPRMTIAPADILGKSLTLSIARKGGDPRIVNGIVSSFSAGPLALRGYRQYTAEIVPTLWLATLRSDCQVFQEKSVVQIVDAMLSDCGVTEVKKQGLSGTHNARPVCVQYRETHFDFIARLLQDELMAKLTERSNQLLYILSVMTAVLLPMTIISGLFGMNVGGLPLLENREGFWIVSVISLAVAGGVYAVVRRLGRSL